MARDPDRVMECRKCKAEGADPVFAGTFAELGRHHQTAHKRTDSPAPGTVPGPGETPPPPDALGAPPAPGEYVRDDEHVPGGVRVDAEGEAAAKPRWRDRVWGGGPARDTSPSSTRERKPERRARRAPTAPVFEFLWRLAGGRIEKSGLDVVVGRCMVYQGPVAGEVLETLTKGTVIDRLIQPLAQNADALETAAALFMLPTLLGMLERNPQMAPVLLPLISDAIEVHLVAMVPIIQKQRDKREKLAKAVAELYPDAEPGTDPIGMVLGEMFAGTVFAEGFTPDAIAQAQEQVDRARGAA